MCEYIKREYAVDAVLDVYYDTPDIDLSGEKFEAAIFKIPPADVAPVRHARWEECHWVEQDGPYSLVAHPKAAFRCNGCKYVFKKELLWKDNYCPNCGCKMDLEG